MANIVITSSTDFIYVDFGVYATNVGFIKGAWRKDKIIHFALTVGNTAVIADTLSGGKFDFSWVASGGNLVVDLVNGIAPISNPDLYDKLVALIST